jgi:alginate O-acetyltransferase complex protein AlgI
MNFGSLSFLFVFLPVVLGVYFLSPGRWLRNVVLVLSSFLFYAYAGPKALGLLAASVLLNYACGRGIERFRGRRSAVKAILVLGIAGNASLLLYFKYLGFFVSTANRLVALDLVVPRILLPAGVSFFTFLGLSYLIDVYRDRAQVLHNPLDVALYMGQFPIVLAGPIVRYEQLAGQLHDRKESLAAFSNGVERFIIGFAKKVIVAGAMAAVGAEIAKVPIGDRSTATVWIAALAFTAQIYFDFSGYSDMAIGLGRMFGFTFPENFDYPYTSKSITEFWRRWHMTLGAWFREYVYIPLGGNRGGDLRLLRNLFVVWLLTGLWHGAAWTFAAWGLYYGCLIALEKFVYGERMESLWSPLRHLYVMLIVVVGWVVFSSASLPQAFAQLRIMAGLGTAGLFDARSAYYLLAYRYEFAIAAAGCLPVLPYLGRVWRKAVPSSALRDLVGYAKPVVLGATLVLCVMFAISTTFSPFLYFKF